MRKVWIPLAAIAAAGVVAVPGTAVSTPGSPPLKTAVFLAPSELKPSNIVLAMHRVRTAGATAVRLPLSWRSVAPARRPPGFQPTDPADPAYNWSAPDRMISKARAAGIEPLVTVYAAPDWAGGTHVDAKQFGLFARAAARRYSGSFHGLPRVRRWLAFNEPNLAKYLSPQYKRGRLVSAIRYRKMVNAFAAAVRRVHRDNVVVAGLLAPLNTPTGPGALKFMRAALCVSGGKHPHPTCRTRVSFDIWSVHPYTSGGPMHRAHGNDGAALGNLPEARKLLRAAVRAGHVRSNRPARLWVTEFSWDSRPPDPLGVPVRLEARWVAEALYRTWKARVGLLTWFQLRDEPLQRTPYQSGLYFKGKSFAAARPKPALTAFRFPFVAYKRGSKVYVWGRIPRGEHRGVEIQRSSGGGWKRVGVLQPNAGGVFFHTYRLHARSSWFLRAELTGGSKKSLRFSLRRSRDHYYPSFGS